MTPRGAAATLADVDAWLASEGFEAALVDELGSGARQLAPGVVAGPDAPGPPRDPVFALQALPGAVLIEAPSIARLAAPAFDALAGPLDAAGPWALHATTALEPLPGEGALATRAERVGTAVGMLFVDHRRRTARRRVELSRAAPEPELHLAQVVLIDAGRALVSCAPVRPLAAGGAWPEPRFPGGRAPVEPDRAAPSSAHRKLEEAWALLGTEPGPGQRCVDLGGSPGGWSWAALRRGAAVLAIDRAPLLPPAAGHPLLEALTGDAFRFRPEAAVDWLLCDVIAAPARTLELLDAWLREGWCRRFVVNVKFTGEERAAPLAALGALLELRGAQARVKHLVHDKNEVTVFGAARA